MSKAAPDRIFRIAELEIDPDQLDTYKLLLAQEIEASVRLEPGVLFLYAVSTKGRPESVRVIEGYASQAAYEEHLTAAHFLTYKAQSAAMVKSLRLIETDLIALAAKSGHLSD